MECLPVTSCSSSKRLSASSVYVWVLFVPYYNGEAASEIKRSLCELHKLISERKGVFFPDHFRYCPTVVCTIVGHFKFVCIEDSMTRPYLISFQECNMYTHIYHVIYSFALNATSVGVFLPLIKGMYYAGFVCWCLLKDHSMLTPPPLPSDTRSTHVCVVGLGVCAQRTQ